MQAIAFFTLVVYIGRVFDVELSDDWKLPVFINSLFSQNISISTTGI